MQEPLIKHYISGVISEADHSQKQENFLLAIINWESNDLSINSYHHCAAGNNAVCLADHSQGLSTSLKLHTAATSPVYLNVNATLSDFTNTPDEFNQKLGTKYGSDSIPDEEKR